MNIHLHVAITLQILIINIIINFFHIQSGLGVYRVHSYYRSRDLSLDTMPSKIFFKWLTIIHGLLK